MSNSAGVWRTCKSENARALIRRTPKDPKRYDLGRVGRFKINQKLGLNTPLIRAF
ncbi:MAG: hypothetical protein ACLUKN_07860 [Bacilli bacterium]